MYNLQEAYLDVYQELDEAGRLHSSSDQQAGFARIKSTEHGFRGKEPISDDEIKKQKGGQEFLDKIEATKKKMKEEVDLYDVILDYLLDEGYTDTIEGAEAIMVSMSEEWRQSIADAYVPFVDGKPEENVAKKQEKLADKWHKKGSEDRFHKIGKVASEMRNKKDQKETEASIRDAAVRRRA